MNEDLSARDTVAPYDTQDVSQATYVECVESFFLALRVQDSPPCRSVVRTQALYTDILVWVVSLHKCATSTHELTHARTRAHTHIHTRERAHTHTHIHTSDRDFCKGGGGDFS